MGHKDTRGSWSYFQKNQEEATKAIDHKFGIAKIFASSQDGEAEDEDETTERHIDLYALSLVKIDELAIRMVMYDLKRIFLISSLILGYKNNLDVANMWNDDETNMFKY